MSVGVRLGLFVAGLGLVFVAAFGAGRALGPGDDGPAPTTVTSDMPAGHDMEAGS
jgi:hypothetical protein